MRQSFIVAFGFCGLFSVCATAAWAENPPPTIIADEHGNLTIEATACAPGVTSGALLQARDVASQMVRDAATKELRNRGVSYVLARQVTEDLPVETTEPKRSDTQFCLNAILFVPQSALAGSHTPQRAETNPETANLRKGSREGKQDDGSFGSSDNTESTISLVYESDLHKLLAMLATLITVLGGVIGIVYHKTILLYFQGFAARVRRRTNP